MLRSFLALAALAAASNSVLAEDKLDCTKALLTKWIGKWECHQHSYNEETQAFDVNIEVHNLIPKDGAKGFEAYRVDDGGDSLILTAYLNEDSVFFDDVEVSIASCERDVLTEGVMMARTSRDFPDIKVKEVWAMTDDSTKNSVDISRDGGNTWIPAFDEVCTRLSGDS